MGTTQGSQDACSTAIVINEQVQLSHRDWLVRVIHHIRYNSVNNGRNKTLLRKVSLLLYLREDVDLSGTELNSSKCGKFQGPIVSKICFRSPELEFDMLNSGSDLGRRMFLDLIWKHRMRLWTAVKYAFRCGARLWAGAKRLYARTHEHHRELVWELIVSVLTYLPFLFLI